MKPIDRRMFLGGAALLSAGLVAGCATSSSDDSGSSSSSTTPPSGGLSFDPKAYTEKTTTIATDAGDKKVTYRFYGPLIYVAHPVNSEYQSLTISVPTSIDGKAIDANDAPIVFANSVGGYMPASVKDSTGVGGSMSMGGMGGPGMSGASGASAAPGGMPSMPGGMPGMAGGASQGSASPSGEVQSGGNAMVNGMGKLVNLAQQAVAAGYVAVEPGCRGRTLVNGSGEYYGVAPAAIVDLKAAIRYLRANADRIPGNTEQIVSTGTSAGGALSSLLGASGNSDLYRTELEALGAAAADDAIFAVGAWCPIADLGHADGAYEWNWGTNPVASTGAQPNQTLSGQLRDQFAAYMPTLKLKGLNNFGDLRAANYNEYLIQTYLQPSATRYLTGLSTADRTAYLQANPFITWSNNAATFTWEGYLTHVGARKKTLPAFDAFDLSAGENNLFGHGTTKARHFTEFSAQRATSGNTTLDADIPKLLDQMNPMYFLEDRNPDRSKHWWIRLGTKDTDTALTVSCNIAAAAAGLGDQVNHLMYWDEGHGANSDAADFIAWIGQITKQ
ncbi:subtype B tannase [Gordonia sp. CPCC 205515]|uniref:subtype B tannase n=1 Tax=Gordonia sp. CPCC 205515 TaxID=3140791 RepID=UPI003AF371CD